MMASDSMIGSFSVDLTYIYKMDQHELFRRWVPLTDVTGETDGVQGYLKISINVLGPGDKPPVHDPTAGLKDKNNDGVSKLFTPFKME